MNHFIIICSILISGCSNESVSNIEADIKEEKKSEVIIKTQGIYGVWQEDTESIQRVLYIEESKDLGFNLTRSDFKNIEGEYLGKLYYYGSCEQIEVYEYLLFEDEEGIKWYDVAIAGIDGIEIGNEGTLKVENGLLVFSLLDKISLVKRKSELVKNPYLYLINLVKSEGDCD